jgi:DNA invertase Pin-like site-specific DNA recombinase
MTLPVLTVTTAYSYVRFSTPQQALGDSLRRQTEKAERYAVEHGLTLDTELNMTDAGVSAFRGKNATTGALGGFLRAVESNHVTPGSYLLIENIDRLSRDHVLEAQTIFSQLILAGIIIVTLTNGEVYSRQRLNEEPYAVLMIVLEQIRANQENVRKSQLIGDAKARKKQQLIEHGVQDKPYTRMTPAWITWSDEATAYELLPDRAAIVREIFERTDAGDGADLIAKNLNRRGTDTWGRGAGKQKANHWRGSYIRKILLSTAPMGTFTPHDITYDEITRARRSTPTALVPNMFPAAVGEELYWRVNRRFATTAPRGKNARHDPKSIVAGIVRCATCGNMVTRVTKGTSRRTYAYLVCSRANMKAAGCKYLAVPYEAIETALRENASWLIAEAPRGKNTAALDREIAGLVTMVDHFSDEASGLADLAAQEKTLVARKRLREKAKELEEAKASLRTITAQRDTLTTASVRDRLKAVKKALGADTVNIVATNQALRQAISRIVMDPEHARLEIYWHHAPWDMHRVASLKLWPGSAASPVSLSDGLTVANRARPATRTLF